MRRGLKEKSAAAYPDADADAAPGWADREEIERVRSQYSGVANPAADYCFSEKETAIMHNKFKDSLTWMNADIYEEHLQISTTRNPHRYVKERFNVHFSKTWGSKKLFMHLVRYGTFSDPVGKIM